MSLPVIVALSTPQGNGCLAIIRASGVNVFEISSNFVKLKSHEFLREAIPNKIYLGKIIDSNLDFDLGTAPNLDLNVKKEFYENKTLSINTNSVLIDIVTAIIYKAPNSFTGENSIEIICHNNPLIISQIINLFIKFGASYAGPGEFSQRAFLNDKIDLLQAEAIHELIVSKNEESLKRSLQQLTGSFSFFLEKISSDLIETISFLEAYFEFQEEDALDLKLETIIKENFINLVNNIELIYKSINNQQKIRNGINISLIGSPNAGKSTVFNALLQKDRAIVCKIPGTTRDLVEAQTIKNGFEWALVDTAGIRKSTDKIEKIGIKKSLSKLIDSDILLVIIDGSSKITKEDMNTYEKINLKHKKKSLFVVNKIDKGLCKENLSWLASKFPQAIKISGKINTNINELENEINLKVKDIFDQNTTPFLLNKRQEILITDLFFNLKTIETAILKNLPLEIVVIDLKNQLNKINAMTGKNMQEKILSEIFSHFCIGK